MREYRTQTPLPIAKDKVKDIFGYYGCRRSLFRANKHPTETAAHHMSVSQRQASRLLPDLHRHQHILLRGLSDIRRRIEACLRLYGHSAVENE